MCVKLVLCHYTLCFLSKFGIPPATKQTLNTPRPHPSPTEGKPSPLRPADGGMGAGVAASVQVPGIAKTPDTRTVL